jgi:DNA-binding NarL/FixJ family response regulator
MDADGALTCVVADDHPAVLDSLARLLRAHGITIAATCRTAEEALEKVTRLGPSVALVDVYMEKMGGIELARRVAASAPETAVVLYTGSTDRALLQEALDAGARGVVLKEAPLADVRRALSMAAAGHTYIDPVLAGKHAVGDAPRLTTRERQVLRLLADGLRNEEIGKQLFISPETVRTHAGKALTKLGARTRVEAVAIALRRSLIS